MFHISTVSVIIFLGFISMANASPRHIDGPVQAVVVRVIDGDTILVEAMPWPDHRISTYVRLRGIDAPEMRSKCSAFRISAKRAQSALSALMEGQIKVTLTAITGDKYFGRVIADLALADGRRPAELLLSAGLVEAYQGKSKARRSCPD